MAKECYYHKDKPEHETWERGKKKDSNKGTKNKNINLVSEDKTDFVNFQTFNISTCTKLNYNNG